MTAYDYKHCPLDPLPGPPIGLSKGDDKRWRANGRRTRTSCIIISSDNGVVFRDVCPVTGEVIESGVIDLGQREAA